jgi:undecaprenyl-diphosphatase
MTFLLVMLHTGTMFAVIAYFWNAWRRAFFTSARQLRESLARVVFATGVTGVVGLVLLQVIKHVVAAGRSDCEIEQLFADARVMTAGLVAAGVFDPVVIGACPTGRFATWGLGAAGSIGAVRACACRPGAFRALAPRSPRA